MHGCGVDESILSKPDYRLNIICNLWAKSLTLQQYLQISWCLKMCWTARKQGEYVFVFCISLCSWTFMWCTLNSSLLCSWLGTILLTWFNFNPSMEKGKITSSKYGMKLLIPSQTYMVQPLKLGMEKQFHATLNYLTVHVITYPCWD